MQNMINAIVQQLKHVHTAQVTPSVQNLQVAQVADRRKIKDNARTIITRVNVKAPDFDGEKKISISSLIGSI